MLCSKSNGKNLQENGDCDDDSDFDDEISDDSDVNSKQSIDSRKRSRSVINEVDDLDENFLKKCKTPAINKYEQQRQKNIAERIAFLESLNIFDTKDDLENSLESLKPKKNTVNRKRPAEKYKDSPIRRSLRLKISYPESNPPQKAVPQTETPPNEISKCRHPSGPLSFSEVFVSDHEVLSEKFLQTLDELTNKKPNLTENGHTNLVFESMVLSEDQIGKVTPNRILSLDMHPSTERILIAGGDKAGGIGFWDIDNSIESHSTYLYKPHTAGVTCLKFSKWNHGEMYSSSYDGTLRCWDIEMRAFMNIHSTKQNENVGLTCFDYFSENGILVSNTDGSISIIDNRVKRLQESYQIHHTVIKCIDVHPINKHYFVTASRDGFVHVWDLRTLRQKTKVLHKFIFGRSVSSAYFSPVTGSKILSTSFDDRIRIFDSKCSGKLNNNNNGVVVIKHNNQTGRWLTPLRAMWLPNCEDAFVSGSMDYPRQIEIYSAAGDIVHSFQSGFLNSVCSINCFHKELPILAGANSSGRVHVFR